MYLKRLERYKNSAILQGSVDSIPICVSFIFLFFAVGSLCVSSGYSFLQTIVMTMLVFAAPLQIFIVQNGESLSLAALVAACVLINFRFLIMSSVLSEKFKGTSLLKALCVIPMLSASTFVVSNACDAKTKGGIFKYYLGVGTASILVAIAATAAGALVLAENLRFLNNVIVMILPIHFTILTALLWPKAKPVLITIVSFCLAPIAGHWLQSFQAIFLPILVAGVFILCDAMTTIKKNRQL